MKKECNCEKCKQCCWNSCGWFGSIEEIMGAAKIMKMSLKEFVKEYLIQEWWAGNDDISIPAPRKNFDRTNQSQSYGFLLENEKEKNGKGFVRASWGHNLMSGFACIFLDKNEKCLIHKSKPRECREAFACEEKYIERASLLSYWKKHQDFIELNCTSSNCLVGRIKTSGGFKWQYQ